MFSVYLAELLDHFFDADVGVLGDFVLHVAEPLTQVLVLLVEHGPLTQALTHLLPAQRELHVHIHTHTHARTHDHTHNNRFVFYLGTIQGQNKFEYVR